MPVPAPRGMKGVGATLAVAQGTGASPVPTVRRYIFKGDVMPCRAPRMMKMRRPARFPGQRSCDMLVGDGWSEGDE